MKTLVRLMMTGHSISVVLDNEFIRTFKITKSFKRERVIQYLDENGFEPCEQSKLSFPWLVDINWSLANA